MGILDFLQPGNADPGILNSLPPAVQQYLMQGQNVTSPAQDPFGPVPPTTQQGPQIAPLALGGPSPQGAGFTDRFSPAFQMPPMANQPPAPHPLAPPAPRPAPVVASDANEPDSMIPVGKYQMPAFAADEGAPGASSAAPTDVSAASRQPQAQPTFLGGAPQNVGFGDRLAAGAQNFIAGGKGGGLLGAVAGGISGLANGARTDPQGMQQQNQKAQYDALIGSGLTPQQAMLSILNPEAGKTILADKFGRDKFTPVKVQDSLGGETVRAFNAADGTIKDVPAGQGTANAPTGIDSTLKGDDYLKQFAPEVQSMVKDYIAGKSVPTGNPRRDNIVKKIASKYGDDIGVPVDDATYFARKQMRTQLSSSAPSSLGGQINIGNTAAGHLADLSQKALELGNYDMGIAPLSAAVNNIRGLGTDQAAKMEALKGAAQHYGQEITKFYAGSPGGTAERDRFIASVNGARSPKELAAILETEGQLMRSRLDALGGQIKGVLGEEGTKQYPVLRSDGQAALTQVEANVSKLRGGGQAPGGKAATVTQNGHTYTLQPDGSYK